MTEMSRVVTAQREGSRAVFDFLEKFEQFDMSGDACDFVAGNPQEMPLPGFVSALQRVTEPRNKEWFAYTLSRPEAQRSVVAGLQRLRGIRYDPNDVFLTTGAFAALAVSFRVLADAGDEIIYISPPWFFYDAMIRAIEAVPVRVECDPATHDLDVDAIAKAITPKTRAIIINSPNNPTGRIYPRATLDKLAAELERASKRLGRRIYLLSDEAYSRILYSGSRFESPTESYPYSFLLYTYGKQLLTPGERIGYIALPPTMPEQMRRDFRGAILVTQIAHGWVFPNATLQYAIADLETLSIDLAHLERKRDRMVAGLKALGYQLHVPDGTFYLLPRSPIPDDVAFAGRLAKDRVYVLPGATVERPGWFRISLTASDAMIDRALPIFASAVRESSPARA